MRSTEACCACGDDKQAAHLGDVGVRLHWVRVPEPRAQCLSRLKRAPVLLVEIESDRKRGVSECGLSLILRTANPDRHVRQRRKPESFCVLH
jgi:hypothetical protein